VVELGPGQTPGETPDGDGIEVYCDCGHLFHAKKSLGGGLTNCPRCHKAVEVSGGPEPLFWILLGGGELVVLTIAALVFLVTKSAPGALIVLIIGAAITGIAVMLS